MDETDLWSKRLKDVGVVLVILTLTFVGAAYYDEYVAAQQNVCQTSGASSNISRTATGKPLAVYDEQLWFTLNRNFSSITYNVTARAQNDSYGFGPGYLLNGLTDSGFWYQVGVSYDWLENFTTPGRGFKFFFEVWNVSTKQSIYPANGDAGLSNFVGEIKPNDTVQLGLAFTNSGEVNMSAIDLVTAAHGSATFPARGASTFVGYTSRHSQYPTSLLTEWYHVPPYFCSPVRVIFSNKALSVKSGWMGVDEWNFSCYKTCRTFDSGDRQEIFFSSPWHPFNPSWITGSDSYQVFGTAVYADSHDFVTM